MKKRQIIILSLLSSFLLSGCNLSIFDIVKGSTGHKEAKADDLSSIQLGSLYSFKSSDLNNDFIPNSLLGGNNKLSYRKIGDIPYITVSDAASLSLADDTKSVTVSVADDIYTYNVKGGLLTLNTITVDSTNDTITISDYDKFLSLVSGVSEINGISSLAEEMNPYVSYDKNNPTEYIAGESVVFNLKDYALDVIAYDSEVYIPFAIASELFFEPMGLTFAYNGKDFYYVSSDGFTKTNSDSLSTYAKDFYSGPLHQKGKSSDYAEFNYNVLCFNIDHFYGFRDKGRCPIDTYLSQNERFLRSSLKSTNNAIYQNAINTLFYGVLGDGHTGVYDYSSIFGNGVNEVASSSFSDRYVTISRSGQELEALREAKLGRNPAGLSYYNKTAIIRFDSFESTYKNFTSNTIRNYVESDSFAMFYSAFKQIQSHGNIENVVIDLSLNGGGAVDALLGILGFLTNSVSANLYNPLSKGKTTLYYAVDTNFDGKVNSSDLMSSYRFFVLTSTYSFSCANLFPSLCKEGKLATIIGEKSGGGACVVHPSVTADGMPFQMSGLSRLSVKQSDGSFLDIDDGVSPDYAFSRKSFYDERTLAAFVESK